MGDSRDSDAVERLDVWAGPQRVTRAERMNVVDRIVRELVAARGDAIVAIGLYGSMVRDADGPFSDIELFCVVNTEGEDECAEWVYGSGKVEVNFYSVDVIRRRAAEVEEAWAIEQGEFYYARPLRGVSAFFESLREAVMSPPAEAFDAAICEIIVGDLYELVGKVRNARDRGAASFLTQAACKCAEFGALMVGLEQRQLYSTSARMLEESLELARLPDGYAALCQRVMAGRLGDADGVVTDIEAFWWGIRSWTRACGIDIGARLTWLW